MFYVTLVHRRSGIVIENYFGRLIPTRESEFIVIYHNLYSLSAFIIIYKEFTFSFLTYVYKPLIVILY